MSKESRLELVVLLRWLIIGMLIGVVILFAKSLKDTNTPPERLPLKYLEKIGLAVTIHDDCHHPPKPGCLESTFRGTVPMIKGIAAILEVEKHLTIGYDIHRLKQRPYEKTTWIEIKGKPTLKLDDLEITGLPEGTYSARMIVTKGKDRVVIEAKEKLIIGKERHQLRTSR